MRIIVLIAALVFIVGLTILTVQGFVNSGVTALGVLSVGIILLFTIAILGSLRHPPRQ